MNYIILSLLTFLFGERAQGEFIDLEYGTGRPTRTIQPVNQPEQFTWFNEYRVSALHRVNQRIYF
jgi:hypothetical protein